MTQQTDQQYLSELVERLEVNLKELKQVLDRYPRVKSRSAKKQRGAKSLYGVFPRTNATLADFRDARQSWSHHPGNF